MDPFDFEECLENGTGLTHRIATCIKTQLIDAATEVASDVYGEVADVINKMATLAVLIAGLAMLGGHRPVWEGPFATAVKVAVVTTIVTNIGAYTNILFDIIEDLVDVVTFVPEVVCYDPGAGGGGGASKMWHVVDCELDMLMGGINSELDIRKGLVGFLTNALVSGGVGAFVAVMGALLIVMFLMTLIQSLYIFVTAYIALALLMAVCPIFLPMLLFGGTRRYFDSWLSMLFSFILQPVALFAYHSVMLVAFDILIFSGDQSLYSVITKGQSNNNNFTSIGAYIEGKDAYVEGSFFDTTVNIDPNMSQEVLKNEVTELPGYQGPTVKFDEPAGCEGVKNLIDCIGTDYVENNELVRNAQQFFKIDQPVSALDWEKLAGGEPDEYIQEVAIAFLSAAITAYILFSLLHKLPYIGAGISGNSAGVPLFGQGALEPSNNLMKKHLSSMISGGAT